MNILVDLIPAKARKYVLYAPYAFAGLVLGAWQIADSPAWLPTALAIYAFVGTALGLTAYANTNELATIEYLTPLEDEADDQARGNDPLGFPYV